MQPVLHRTLQFGGSKCCTRAQHYCCNALAEGHGKVPSLGAKDTSEGMCLTSNLETH